MNNPTKAELRQISETALITILAEDFRIHLAPGEIKDFKLTGDEVHPELYEMAYNYASETYAQINKHVEP